VLVPGVSVTLVSVDELTSSGTVPLTTPDAAEIFVVPAVSAFATPIGEVVLTVATPGLLLAHIT
jgi:hypothetical protein